MTALLVLLLGAGSLTLQVTSGRPQGSRRTVLLLAGGGLIVVAVLAGLVLLGAGLIGTAVALVGAAWVFVNLRLADERTLLARWGAMILVVAICTVIDAHSGGHGLGPAGSIDRLTAGAAALMLLTTPANEAVAAVLALVRGADVAGRVRRDEPRTAPAGSETDAVVDGSADPLDARQTERETSSATSEGSVVGAADRRDDALPALHGGRWIGPLERVLLVLLAGASANVALAAIIAGKGVIRFPEISKDSSGRKAEEFLIGSLTSWMLAVLGALLLVA